MTARYIPKPDTAHPNHCVVFDTHTQTPVTFLGSVGTFEDPDDAADLAERLSQSYERARKP